MPQQWRNSQFLLGIEGLALLREWLTGDEVAIGARVREIEELCRRYGDPPEGDAFEADEISASTGYNVLAGMYDDVKNPLIAAEEPSVRGLLDGLEKGRVVDAACGTGRHASYLAQRGHAVTAVDALQAMLLEAKKKVPGAAFVQGDLNALPLGTNSHDAAVCALALGHLRELRPAVGELARVVRPGGEIVLSDIHPFAAVTGAHSVVPTGDGRFGVLRNEFHPHSSYVDAFRDAGLEVLACLEPLWETDLYGGGGVLDPIREAAATALDGLPFALIWRLRVG
ncbi:MAG TPA: methyltransferase domain-containing protein [Actinomycetota bacterium]|nr:methyltransferase domain-containing protein [Actinomycetota bacterium]